MVVVRLDQPVFFAIGKDGRQGCRIVDIVDGGGLQLDAVE